MRRNVGMLPPNSSDEEDEAPQARRGAARAAEAPAAPIDPKIAARLEEVRRRRELQRQQRIEAEGFDRYAPPKEGENRPDVPRRTRDESSSDDDGDDSGSD